MEMEVACRFAGDPFVRRAHLVAQGFGVKTDGALVGHDDSPRVAERPPSRPVWFHSGSERKQGLADALALRLADEIADDGCEAFVLDAGQDVLPAVGLEYRVADALNLLP